MSSASRAAYTADPLRQSLGVGDAHAVDDAEQLRIRLIVVRDPVDRNMSAYRGMTSGSVRRDD